VSPPKVGFGLGSRERLKLSGMRDGLSWKYPALEELKRWFKKSLSL
jgi:hypothetical protein